MVTRACRLRDTNALTTNAGAAAHASGYARPATTPATHVRTTVARVGSVERVASQMHNKMVKVSSETGNSAAKYTWPGNTAASARQAMRLDVPPRVALS